MPLTLQEVLELNRQTGRGFDDEGNFRPFTSEEFLQVSIELGSTQLFPPYRALHENLAAWIKNTLNPKTTLEIGSGPGYLLSCLADMGIDAQGVDGSLASQAFFFQHHPPHRARYVIDPTLTGAYLKKDVVLAIEVFEHIPDDGLGNILHKIKSEIQPRWIVFSSTPHEDPNPGWDLQWGHINIKRPEEWQSLFKKYGFELDDARKPPVTEWAQLYVNKNRHKYLANYSFNLQSS
ncbi:class I SAM-dependent methyltransferase [Ottowia testudinis]|uniref:Class I SAM-dependent methyltransferase n=1 Tax=Ottowia testudinis TaxID=2816950 RepID=A0A975CIK8_9BURK|nr:class I SAM-dependent methyltransferase [Ottowia testudinis]QTD45761.1 class I SAM-dependent methyltransferase [Ottowia testudinis]